MLRELRLSPLMIAALCLLVAVNGLAAVFLERAFAPASLSERTAKTDWRAPSAIDASTPFAEAPPKDEETLGRPIFFSSRRLPRRKATASAAMSGLPAGLNLRGVIKAGSVRSVFLVWDAFAEGKWVSAGDVVETWRVSDIGDLAATLTRAETSLQLVLDYAAEASPQPVERRPPPLEKSGFGPSRAPPNG